MRKDSVPSNGLQQPTIHPGDSLLAESTVKYHQEGGEEGNGPATRCDNSTPPLSQALGDNAKEGEDTEIKRLKEKRIRPTKIQPLRGSG